MHQFIPNEYCYTTCWLAKVKNDLHALWANILHIQSTKTLIFFHSQQWLLADDAVKYAYKGEHFRYFFLKRLNKTSCQAAT